MLRRENAGDKMGATSPSCARNGFWWKTSPPPARRHGRIPARCWIWADGIETRCLAVRRSAAAATPGGRV